MQHPLDKFRYCPKCGSEKFLVHEERAKKCKECGFTYYLNAVAAVATLLFNEKGELLLCRRAHNPGIGMLDLPGGFLELGETAEEAVAREIKEELNLELSDITYLCSQPNLYNYSDFTVHTLDMFYKAKIVDQTNLYCADDVASAQFYALKDINIDDIAFISIREVVSKLISNK